MFHLVLLQEAGAPQLFQSFLEFFRVQLFHLLREFVVDGYATVHEGSLEFFRLWYFPHVYSSYSLAYARCYQLE